MFLEVHFNQDTIESAYDRHWLLLAYFKVRRHVFVIYNAILV